MDVAANASKKLISEINAPFEFRDEVYKEIEQTAARQITAIRDFFNELIQYTRIRIQNSLLANKEEEDREELWKLFARYGIALTLDASIHTCIERLHQQMPTAPSTANEYREQKMIRDLHFEWNSVYRVGVNQHLQPQIDGYQYVRGEDLTSRLFSLPWKELWTNSLWKALKPPVRKQMSLPLLGKPLGVEEPPLDKQQIRPVDANVAPFIAVRAATDTTTCARQLIQMTSRHGQIRAMWSLTNRQFLLNRFKLEQHFDRMHQTLASFLGENQRLFTEPHKVWTASVHSLGELLRDLDLRMKRVFTSSSSSSSDELSKLITDTRTKFRSLREHLNDEVCPTLTELQTKQMNDVQPLLPVVGTDSHYETWIKRILTEFKKTAETETARILSLRENHSLSSVSSSSSVATTITTVPSMQEQHNLLFELYSVQMNRALKSNAYVALESVDSWRLHTSDFCNNMFVFSSNKTKEHAELFKTVEQPDLLFENQLRWMNELKTRQNCTYYFAPKTVDLAALAAHCRDLIWIRTAFEDINECETTIVTNMNRIAEALNTKADHLPALGQFISMITLEQKTTFLRRLDEIRALETEVWPNELKTSTAAGLSHILPLIDGTDFRVAASRFQSSIMPLFHKSMDFEYRQYASFVYRCMDACPVGPVHRDIIRLHSPASMLSSLMNAIQTVPLADILNNHNNFPVFGAWIQKLIQTFRDSCVVIFGVLDQFTLSSFSSSSSKQQPLFATWMESTNPLIWSYSENPLLMATTTDMGTVSSLSSSSSIRRIIDSDLQLKRNSLSSWLLLSSSSSSSSSCSSVAQSPVSTSHPTATASSAAATTTLSLTAIHSDDTKHDGGGGGGDSRRRIRKQKRREDKATEKEEEEEEGGGVGDGKTNNNSGDNLHSIKLLCWNRLQFIHTCMQFIRERSNPSPSSSSSSSATISFSSFDFISQCLSMQMREDCERVLFASQIASSSASLLLLLSPPSS